VYTGVDDEALAQIVADLEAEASLEPALLHARWVLAAGASSHAVPSLTEVAQGHAMALHNTLLRLLWNLLREALLDPHTTRFEALHPDGAVTSLEHPDALQRLIYTRPAHPPSTIHHVRDDGTRAPLTDLLGFWRTLVEPAVGHLGDAWSRALAMREIVNSFHNEVYAMALQAQLHAAIVRGSPAHHDAWTWLLDRDGLARWATAEATTDEAVISRLSSLHGHRLHPTAHARLRVLADKNAADRTLRPAEGRAPVEALDLAEMLANLGAAGSIDRLPVAALRRDVSAARGLVCDDGIYTARDLTHDDYRERFAASFPEALVAWRDWLRAAGRDPDAYVPLLLHPLNVTPLTQRYGAWLDASAGAPQLILPDLARPHGPWVLARIGMSARTFMPLGDGLPSHAKLALPVQVTSARRSLPPALAHCAPGQSALLLNILRQRPALGAVMRVVPESTSVFVRGWRGDDDASARRYADGFFLSCVLRDNPMRLVDEAQLCVPLALLFATSPFTGAPLYADLLRARGVTEARGALDAFTAHVRTVMRGPLCLFLEDGVALEPHQQNMLLVFDRETGALAQTLHRDFGDDTLSYLPIQRLQGHTLPGGLIVRPDTSDLLHDDAPLGDGVTRDEALRIGLETCVRQVHHTLYTSHLGPMIDVLHAEFSVDAAEARGVVRAHLRETIAQCRRRFDEAHDDPAQRDDYHARLTHIDAMLTGDWIEAKGFLSARLRQSGHLRSVRLRNPLAHE
jgi:IucA / IucC family/Ferric iron reductase FhuF-like transporter